MAASPDRRAQARWVRAAEDRQSPLPRPPTVAGARTRGADAVLDLSRPPAPAMCSAVRQHLGHDRTEEIRTALSAGSVVCTVCESPIVPGWERHPSVLVLRGPGGHTQVRFAHERCGESRLIDLQHRPMVPTADADQTHRAPVAWALSARRGRVPTIVLANDLALLEHLDVRGHTLLEALRLEQLRGGGPLTELSPARCDALALAREGSTLWLSTPYGSEALQLGSAEPAASLLQVAAHQGELLIVLGVGLQLSSGSLDCVERQLRDDHAVAARVRFDDTELKLRPLGGSRGSLVSVLARLRRRRAVRTGARRYLAA